MSENKETGERVATATRQPYSVRLPDSTRKQLKELVALGLYQSEADALVAAVHGLVMDTPTVAQRASELSTLIDNQASQLYWTWQDGAERPRPEFDYYTWLMRIDGELDAFSGPPQNQEDD